MQFYSRCLTEALAKQRIYIYTRITANFILKRAGTKSLPKQKIYISHLHKIQRHCYLTAELEIFSRADNIYNNFSLDLQTLSCESRAGTKSLAKQRIYVYSIPELDLKAMPSTLAIYSRVKIKYLAR